MKAYQATFATLWCCCLLLLAGCEPAPQIARFSGATMGTTWNVTLATPVSEAAQANVEQAITAELARINRLMSTWDPESELSRFNKHTSLTAVQLSGEVIQVLNIAQDISNASDGAFDVTVGPLVNLWGFGPEMKPDKVPTEAELEDVFTRVGYRKLRVDGHLVRREGNVYVDLSAIAKGYGVDRIADLLETMSYHNYLVEIGGELRARGRKLDGSPWRIGIEAPDVEGRSARRIVRVENIGVATSGDYRNYFEQDGQRYSHTINPATGKPIRHKLASVTVLAESAAKADGWATALLVLGPERGLETAQAQGIAAFFIIRDHNGYVERHTEPFQRYLEPNS